MTPIEAIDKSGFNPKDPSTAKPLLALLHAGNVQDGQWYRHCTEQHEKTRQVIWWALRFECNKFSKSASFDEWLEYFNFKTEQYK